MAFSKNPTKVTTIKEYGPTTAPDSAYPKASESTIKNDQSESNGYTATGELEVGLLPSRISEGSFSSNSVLNQSKGISNTLQNWAAIFTMLSAIGLAIWYLSKMDSNIDIVKKSIENHESKIENLKDNVTNALFRIDNLEKNDSSKKNSPEVEQPDVASEKQ